MAALLSPLLVQLLTFGGNFTAGGRYRSRHRAVAEPLRRRLAPPPRLKWIRASVGNTLRLIPVEQALYLKSDNKYPMVVRDGGRR